MKDQARLDDVRQIGPDSERSISGICSSCGDTLLVSLEDSSIRPTPGILRAELEKLFQRHKTEKHSSQPQQPRTP